MNKLTLTVLASALSFQTHAQVAKVDEIKKSLATTNKDTVAWLHNGLLTLGANEGFLHNWAAGGELASMVLTGVFHGSLAYLNHGSVWENDLDLAYGLSYTYSNNFVPRKTDDRIDFTSKYGSQLHKSKDFYFAGLFNFKSQFTKGYNYTDSGWQHKPTSEWLSPAYLTLAAGMEYRKGEHFSLFLSPLAAREIIGSSYFTSQSPSGAFGIDSGKTSKFQLGAYFSGRYKKGLTKALNFSTRLDLYSNYLAKNTVNPAGMLVKKDNPGNIQVYWDNLLVLKAYKTLSVTFGVTVAYDNSFPYSQTTLDTKTGMQQDKGQPAEGLGWVQLSQIFTFGVAYKFN